MDTDQRKLLRKFLDGQCSSQEQRQVKMLLDTPEGKAAMQELMEEQDVLAGLYASPGADERGLDDKVEIWKEQVRERIASTEGSGSRPVRKLRFLRMAAVWTGILFAGGVGVWQIRHAISPEQAVAYIKKENLRGVPVQHMLPDSTSVYLAAGSALSYPKDYPESGREVTLQGAAFFDVKQDEAHPFIIHTGEVQTQVLGTSFRVSAFEGEPLEVAVATGKVGVSAKAGKEQRGLAILTPGLKISYDRATAKASTGRVDISGLEQWRSGELVFDEQPLGLVAHELQRRFGVTVVCKDPETAGYRVSGAFAATEPVEKVLKMLSILGKFRCEAQGDSTFHLYKTGDTQQ
jgi:transmembrane sensor